MKESESWSDGLLTSMSRTEKTWRERKRAAVTCAINAEARPGAGETRKCASSRAAGK